jgi:twinkle protein
MFCFSCETYTPGAGEDVTDGRHQSPSSFTYEGDFAQIASRRITEATCRKFNVRVDSGPVIRFPYTDQSGRVVGAKERDKAKNFRWIGKNTEKRLFGQNLFGGGKRLVITEGEMDALSTWEAQPKWPVVSIYSGAAGAYRDLQNQLSFCLSFDEVVLLFDNDGPGQEAAIKCAQLFPPDKVKIASMGAYKDASEALQARDGEAIRQAIWNAAPYTPKTIIDGRSLLDVLRRPMVGRDAHWPFDGLDSVTGGLRFGELVTVTAGSGVGKSTLCGETAQSLVQQGFNVGYIALEESIQRTGLRLMSVVANKPLHLDNSLPAEEFKTAFDQSVGSGQVFLRDGFGSVDPEVILNDIRFMVKSRGVSWVILDHLSILLSGNASDDERKLIDMTMTKLRSFVEETRVGLILISHLRRLHNDKGHEDGGQVSLSHLRGSHSIVQLSDLVVSIERNLSAGEDTATLRVLKNRFSGVTGEAGIIQYNRETGRMQQLLAPAGGDVAKAADYSDF